MPINLSLIEVEDIFSLMLSNNLAGNVESSLWLICADSSAALFINSRRKFACDSIADFSFFIFSILCALIKVNSALGMDLSKKSLL